jgi:hypothetical protein
VKARQDSSIFSSGMLVMCRTRDDTYHSCKIPPVVRPVNAGQDVSIFSSDAILCSKAEHAADVHNQDGTDHSCKVWLKSVQ